MPTSPRTSVTMEKINMDFWMDKGTKRVLRVSKFLTASSYILIAYGISQLIIDRDMSEDAFMTVLESGIPAAFMAVSDMLFMELVATDLLVNLCVSLNIFNGFMERDVDLHSLVCVMGMQKLTGRGSLTSESIKRETISPLRSSKRLSPRSPPVSPQSSCADQNSEGMPTEAVLAELAVLRELQKEWWKRQR